MTEYIVAVKRDQRRLVPPNWLEDLEGLTGVIVKREAGENRVNVLASPEGIEALKKKLGAYCHIEPIIRHRPLAEE